MNKLSDIKVEYNSFIALHVQLHNQLRQLILSGQWATGSRVPPENKLSTYLKISRTTVRLALQQAELEGLIERIPGKGTFVTAYPRHDGSRRLIAFATCRFDDEYHLFMLNGAESEARANGYRVIFSKLHDYQEEIDLIKRLREEQVAGMVLWPNPDYTLSPQENRLNYQQAGLPMVFMDRSIDGVECDCVTSDNYGGAYALMKHLVDLGHQRIVFLTHRKTKLLTIQERYRAYCDVMRQAGFKPEEPWLMGEPEREILASDVFRVSDETINPRLDEIKEHLLCSPPTAIFGVNDFAAVLAMQAAKSLNMKIPDDLSIAGFDDIDLAVYLEVPLTTVAQDAFMIGKRATRRLIDRLEGYSGPAECEIIPTQLRVRSSTAVPMVPERR